MLVGDSAPDPEQVFIRPGQLYSTSGIDRTYEALNRLAILRYVNIVTRRHRQSRGCIQGVPAA